MWRALVVAMVLAGCGSPPPLVRHAPPPTTNAATTVTSTPDEVLRPVVEPEPPTVRLAKLLPGPTWPLTAPPSREPHYRVASPWFAACEKRGHLPDDALAYVEAWCRYRREGFDLVSALLPLRTSNVVGLGDAIRRDVANLVADSRSGQAALTWLATAASNEDSMFEHVIAVYTDLGRFDDAVIVAKEYVARGSPRCTRELVEARFAIDLWDRSDALFERARSYGLGTSCGAALQHLGCIASEAVRQAVFSPMVPRPDCASILDEDERVASRLLAAVRSVARLRFERMGHEYILAEAAAIASTALQLSDAEPFALDALEASSRMSCRMAYRISEVAFNIDGSPDAQPQLAARRAALRAITPQTCDAGRK